MFRAQNMVPDFYIEKSRDFQVLCRLYDLNFNALKYNIDSSGTLTDTRAVKDTFLPLIGDKFGIYDEKSYSNRFLLESLPAAVKNKGSLKSISTLLNAFLDSMGIFEYALAYNAKDEESAEEISFLLNREVKPYTIVIVLSQYPGLTDLNILKEYMNMVIPTGMNVEYMFATQKYIFDKFKYNEHVFLFYVMDKNTTYKVGTKTVTTHFPEIGNVYNTSDYYEMDTLTTIENFTGDGTTTEFTLSNNPHKLIKVTVDDVEITIDDSTLPTPAGKVGLNQYKVTFGTAPTSDSEIVISYESYFNRRVVTGGGKNAYDDRAGFEINIVGIATVSTDEGRGNN